MGMFDPNRFIERNKVFAINRRGNPEKCWMTVESEVCIRELQRALCSSLMHTSDSTVIQHFSGLPRLLMAKTLFLSMKRFGSNIPILVDQLLGTKTVPPNGTTLISMKERMAMRSFIEIRVVPLGGTVLVPSN